jgi:RNA polymerase sigma factor (sigma-70 family)
MARLVRNELIARVRWALSRLAEDDREILLLRHLEQLKLVECAEVLQISQSATKKRYLRALQRLHRSLGEGLSGDMS